MKANFGAAHESETDRDYPAKKTMIGILQSNARTPILPGAVVDRRSFNFPVFYRVVDELTSKRLIEEADPSLAEPIIREAQILERSGVAAIMGDCGHLIQFQRDVATAVNIPVFLSSWLQVPFIHHILPHGEQPLFQEGILTMGGNRGLDRFASSWHARPARVLGGIYPRAWNVKSTNYRR
jgi:hypothetical protein